MSGSGFAIFVEVTVHPEHFAECLRLTCEAAERNVANDPGCRQIDVSTRNDGAPVIHLYEVYDDVAAFQAHLKTPGFVAWRESTKAMLVEMRVLARLSLKHAARAS